MVSEQRKKIHPHKFTLWMAMGSIVMMFAGLTSAFIVKRTLPNWTTFQMPTIFWYSTAILLLSSVTIYLAEKGFKEREMNRYRSLISATAVLGVVFIVLQTIGFSQLWHQGIQLKGAGGGQFLYVIFGLHGLHVFAGVIALIVIFLKAFFSNKRNYNPVQIEVMSTYWHFVDLLWVYLFVFFLWIQ